MQIRKSILPLLQTDWTNRNFALSMSEYDRSVLQLPLTFSSLHLLVCPIITTDEGKKRINQIIAEEYCRSVEEVLKQKRFTECGGLLLKRLVRLLQEELVEILGDEVMGCEPLNRLLLFSVLVSVPIDTENVDELVKMAHVSMTRDEYRELLGLRIAQDLCVCIKQSTKLYHLHASSRH